MGLSPFLVEGFGLNSRSGNSEQLAKMIATCRAAGVQAPTVCWLVWGWGIGDGFLGGKGWFNKGPLKKHMKGHLFFLGGMKNNTNL